MARDSASDNGASINPSEDAETPRAQRPQAPIAGTLIALGVALVGAVVSGVTIGEGSNRHFVIYLVEAPFVRSDALFVFACGVLLSLVERGRPGGLRRPVLIRGGLILSGLGMLLSAMLPTSVLMSLGALIALTPWLITARVRTLMIGTAACFVLGAAVVPAFGDNFVTWAYQRGGLFGTSVQWLGATLFSMYPLAVWAGFFFIGIAIGRLDLTQRRTAIQMFAGGAVFATLFTVGFHAINSFVQADATTAYAAALHACENRSLQQGLVVGPDGVIRWPNGAVVEAESLPPACKQLTEGRAVTVQTFTSFEPYSASTAWSLQATALAVTALGLCLLVSRSRFTWPLRALGSISLTGYCAYLAIIDDVWTLLNGTTSGRPPRFGEPVQLALMLVLVGVLLGAAVLIRRRWDRGPIEWLLDLAPKAPPEPAPRPDPYY